MALTRTRNRTQTALTKLATRLAETRGELAFVQDWLATGDAPPSLASRQAVLLQQENALTATLKRFDPALDISRVASLDTWQKTYGKRLSQKTLKLRYVEALRQAQP